MPGFLNISFAQILRQPFVAAQNAIKQNTVARIMAPFKKIQTFLKLEVFYQSPWYVTLFTLRDQAQHENKVLGMSLNTAKPINLNPTQPGDPNYDTILESIKNGSIVLYWVALVQIFQGKMFNIGNKHLPKYIQGVGCANLNNAQILGYRREFGLPTANLTPKMEKIKNLFCVQYLGFALNTLFTMRPDCIVKKPYYIQKYVKGSV